VTVSAFNQTLACQKLDEVRWKREIILEAVADQRVKRAKLKQKDRQQAFGNNSGVPLWIGTRRDRLLLMGR